MIFTDKNFMNEVEKSKELVLVDFYANWCGPCKMLSPIIEDLTNEYKNKKVKIGKINVDENQNNAQKYNVMSIPTLLFMKEGKIIDQITGLVTKEEIKNIIDRNI